MKSKTRWDLDTGSIILKYRMAGKYYYLLYKAGEPLECGDYKTCGTLKEAKKLDSA